MEDFAEDGHVKDVQEIFKQKFEHLKSLDKNIPGIPIGIKIYSTQVPLTVKAISKQKFIWNALQSPYELLKAKYDKVKTQVDGINCIG